MSFPIHIANTQEEKEAIYRFRYRVYVEELKKMHLPADHERKLMYDEADGHSVLLYAMDKDRIIATVRAIFGGYGTFLQEDIDFFDLPHFVKIFKQNEISVVNRLIVDKAYRHTSLTNEMMKATYVEGKKEGITLCFITCDSLLLNFYYKYGFRTYRDPVIIKNNQRRYHLVLTLNDLAHLQKVQSPFVKILPVSDDDQSQYAKKITQDLGYSLHNRTIPMKARITIAVYKTIIKFKNKHNKT